jgi:hypothetical protein
MRDHLDDILADIYYPDAVALIDRIKQKMHDDDERAERIRIKQTSDTWMREHFSPVDLEPSIWDDRPGLFIAVVVIVSIISLIASTLDYWGK